MKITTNRALLRRLLLFFVILGLIMLETEANIVDLEGIKVAPLTFVYKNRYVYSDMADPKTPLQNAYVNLDLKLKPYNL